MISPVHEDALRQLRLEHDVRLELDPAQDALPDLVRSCEVLVMRSGVVLDARVLERAERLRLVVRAGAGTDNIDMAAATTKRHPRSSPSPAPGAKAVAEMAFALMLALARNVLEADRVAARRPMAQARAHRPEPGRQDAGRPRRRQHRRPGRPAGDRVGDDGPRRPSSPRARHRRCTGAEGIEVVPVDELLRRSDYVSVHVPLAPRTRGMLDARALGS